MQMLLGPGSRRIAQLPPEQELAEPVAGAGEVAADVLARANEIAQGLLLDARDANERERAGGELTGEVLGVAAVGLDPVGRLLRDQSGRADPQVEASLGGHPRQRHPGRTCLIDTDHPTFDCGQEGEDVGRPSRDPSPAQLARLLAEHRGGGLVGMDVEAHPADSFEHGQHPPAMSPGRWLSPIASGPRISARGADSLTSLGRRSKGRDGSGTSHTV